MLCDEKGILEAGIGVALAGSNWPRFLSRQACMGCAAWKCRMNATPSAIVNGLNISVREERPTLAAGSM